MKLEKKWIWGIIFFCSVTLFANETALGSTESWASPKLCGFEKTKPLYTLAAIEAIKDYFEIAQATSCPAGNLECRTDYCKDESGIYYCCPSDYPYISHCNCRCYKTHEDATTGASPECHSATQCR